MALKTPMFLELNTTSQNADEFRNLTKALVSVTGVATLTDFAVTQRSAGANLSVDVAAGNLILPGSESTHQGYYGVLNDATVNVAVTAGHATNPRKDLVIVRVRDAFYSGANNDAELLVVAGTPAASPAEPDLVALGYKNYYVLAMIDVPANDTTITDSQITSRRSVINARGGTVVTTSATRPSSPYEGLVIYETDTDKLMKYNGATWVRVDSDVVIGVALSDEVSSLTNTGNPKSTMRAPYAFTLTGMRASVNTASTSGVVTVDINENGTTILSTKLTIDANEKTSVSAATPAVISDSAIADDAELTFDIDTAGTNAKGLKVFLYGTRT